MFSFLSSSHSSKEAVEKKEEMEDDSRKSLVTVAGTNAGHCGYCEGDASVKVGIVSRFMLPQHYEALMFRGWRRSGTYFYQPCNAVTCCPHYPIRLEAAKFRPNKQQRRVLSAMERYVQTGKKEAAAAVAEDSDVMSTDTPAAAPAAEATSGPNAVVQTVQGSLKEILQRWSQSSPSTEAAVPRVDFDIDEFLSAVQTSSVFDGVPPKLTKMDEDHPLIAWSNVAFKLAAKWKSGSSAMSAPQCSKLLEAAWNAEDREFVALSSPSGHLNFLLKKAGEMENWKGQCGAVDTDAHEEKKKTKTKEKKSPAAAAAAAAPSEEGKEEKSSDPVHRLEIEVVKATLMEETYELFRKYQIAVHKDAPSDVTKASYRRFLIDNPFPPESEFGCYHHLYRVDGKIIAVGVLDLLPTSLSSVYLFYDPDWSFLSLGKFTALKEIEFTLQRQKTHPNFRYYVMGYYIHSCAKMRYKADYEPSELYCILSKKWKLHSDVRQLLDGGHPARALDTVAPESSSAAKQITRLTPALPIAVGNSTATLKDILKRNPKTQGLFEEYVRAVGVDLGPKLLLQFN